MNVFAPRSGSLPRWTAAVLSIGADPPYPTGVYIAAKIGDGSPRQFECVTCRSVSMSFPRASQALARFTVLDLTRVRAGPTCVRQLADWGANVVKIEPPARLSSGRSVSPPGRWW